MKPREYAKGVVEEGRKKGITPEQLSQQYIEVAAYILMWGDEEK